MKLRVCFAVLLLAFGVPKVFLEQRLLETQRLHGFQVAQWNKGLRGQIGQMGFVAALSGFRAIMADVVWLKAYSAFERSEWGRMKLLLDSATQLQPKAILFWEMAHFHMAYDAAMSVRLNEDLQPSDALRRRAERQYLQIGEQFLLDGIAFNPDSARLRERLGTLYANRFHDPSRAADAFLESSRKVGAMDYVRGFAGYQMAKVPGREREAYQLLREVHANKAARGLQFPPTLLHVLADLENKLEVPKADRIGSSAPAQ